MSFFFRKLNLAKKKKKWQQEKLIIQQEADLEKEQLAFKEQNKVEKKKKISTSKKIILFLFINCSVIEIFTGIITIMDLHLVSQTGMVDFTPIVTLIGAVVGEIIGFAIYAAKAAKENTVGGIVYQKMLNEQRQQQPEEYIHSMGESTFEE